MTQATDYYTVMGLNKHATDKEIKMAYRRLARKYHPDLNKDPQAEEKFKALGQAYDVLKDPEKRAAYDQFGPHWEQQQQAQQAYQSTGYHHTADTGGFQFDEDLLSSLFGHRRQRPHAATGETYHANLTLSLEESYHGATRQIEISPQKQTLSVKIPAGVTQGQKIRLKGQGGPGINQGPKGDLYLTIHFHPHPLYELKEKDLYLTLPIAPWEAALGASIKVPTLGGSVELKIPPSSQSGQKLRLKGRGLPGKPSGDQYILLKIVMPPTTSEAAKEIYEKMAQTMPFNPRAHMGG